MAQEKRNLSALDVNIFITWTNESYAFIENDNCASSSAFSAAGYAGGGNYQDISQEPTSLDEFKVRFVDLGQDHADDTFILQVYNPATVAWENLETFNQFSKLPSFLTTKDYTFAMQSKYTAAFNKTAFLNGLQVRIYQSAKSGGPDSVSIGLAWSNFTYSYSSGWTGNCNGRVNPDNINGRPKANVSSVNGRSSD